MTPPLHLSAWAIAIVCAVSEIAAAPLRMEVSRDTWVSAVGAESRGNNGGSPRLKLKGIQEIAIVDLDPNPLKGKFIARAELHVKSASVDRLHRLTVSTLASDWAEGTGSNYERQDGAATFDWAKLNVQRWAGLNSDITAVSLSQGHTIWTAAEAAPPDNEGWQTISIDPKLLAARIAGISQGFVVVDDVGSEYERDGDRFKYKLFPNRFVYSREQGNAKPYFTIELAGQSSLAPAAVTHLIQHTDNSQPGETRVTWESPDAPKDSPVVGFFVRAGGEQSRWEVATPVAQYLVPMAGAPSETVELHLPDRDKPRTLFVQAVDGAGNLSPVATTSITPTAPRPAITLAMAPTSSQDIAPLPQLGGCSIAIVDALDKVQPVTGEMIPPHPEKYLHANHLWSAADKTIRLYAARNEFADFQILLSGESNSVDARLTFDERIAKAEVLRFNSVDTKRGPLPDPLVPLHSPRQSIEGRKHDSLLVDLYVPHDAPAGVHNGTLTLNVDGHSTDLAIELHVWDFALPDVLSFIPEMNCYDLPAGQEIAYYRLAQVHRTNLNRLGYNWRGKPAEGCAPKWDGQSFDWTEYDRHYAPLLDGTAFKDLPRDSVPVESCYLPLNENWPIDVNSHFKGGYWADQAFDAVYEKEFTRACAAFAEHFRDKGWARTIAEFYLNNKVYFKGDDWRKCSAPWVFDEPRDAQDFTALRFYGTLFHAGVDPVRGNAQLGMRCDISYPQWQRDFLDGLLDVDVSGGGFRKYNRLVTDRRRRNGEITFNYGTSNDVENSNLQPLAWCLDTWRLGGDGVLPWQTVGNEQSWKTGDALCLFYPTPTGPQPSVRLKSYRRGQQDVEYLALLQQATAAPREAIADLVDRELKLEAQVIKHSEADAGIAVYDKLDPLTLWTFRTRLGATLSALHPNAVTHTWKLAQRGRPTHEPGTAYSR